MDRLVFGSVLGIRSITPPKLSASGFGNQWFKKWSKQRNRWERSVCRSVAERTELLPIKPKTSPLCHSDRSVSGVEKSTTWEKEPPQDKICNSGRFLDSLRSLGMTHRWVVPIIRTGYIRNVPGKAHRPFRER